MHKGKNYQDFLKWRGEGEGVLLGHSLIIVKWTWGVFFTKDCLIFFKKLSCEGNLYSYVFLNVGWHCHPPSVVPGTKGLRVFSVWTTFFREKTKMVKLIVKRTAVLSKQ